MAVSPRNLDGREEGRAESKGQDRRLNLRSVDLTVSTLPLRILSVVAWTLPPVRCRSHNIARRSTCGNICCILSTAASLALAALAASRGDCLCPDCVAADPEKKKYRIVRPKMRTTRMSEESDICSSAMAVSMPTRAGRMLTSSFNLWNEEASEETRW